MRVLHLLDHSPPRSSPYVDRVMAILRHQRALGWQTWQLTGLRQDAPESPHQSGGDPALAEPPSSQPAKVADLSDDTEDERHAWHYFRTQAPVGLCGRLPLLGPWHALARRLDQVMRLTRPDIVHAHSPTELAVAAWWVARRHKVPVVFEVHAPSALAQPGASWTAHPAPSAGAATLARRRWAEAWVARRVAAVVTNTEGMRERLVRAGVRTDQLKVIPDGIATTPHPALPGRRRRARPDSDLSTLLPRLFGDGEKATAFQSSPAPRHERAVPSWRGSNAGTGLYATGGGEAAGTDNVSAFASSRAENWAAAPAVASALPAVAGNSDARPARASGRAELPVDPAALAARTIGRAAGFVLPYASADSSGDAATVMALCREADGSLRQAGRSGWAHVAQPVGAPPAGACDGPVADVVLGFEMDLGQFGDLAAIERLLRAAQSLNEHSGRYRPAVRLLASCAGPGELAALTMLARQLGLADRLMVLAPFDTDHHAPPGSGNTADALPFGAGTPDRRGQHGGSAIDAGNGLHDRHGAHEKNGRKERAEQDAGADKHGASTREQPCVTRVKSPAQQQALLRRCSDCIVILHGGGNREAAPSRRVLAAMASGNVVAAVDSPANRSLLEPGRTGMLFEPDNCGALTDALAALIANRPNWPAMAAAARWFIEYHRNWESCVSQYDDLYRSVIEKRRRRR